MGARQFPPGRTRPAPHDTAAREPTLVRAAWIRSRIWHRTSPNPNPDPPHRPAGQFPTGRTRPAPHDSAARGPTSVPASWIRSRIWHRTSPNPNPDPGFDSGTPLVSSAQRQVRANTSVWASVGGSFGDPCAVRHPSGSSTAGIIKVQPAGARAACRYIFWRLARVGQRCLAGRARHDRTGEPALSSVRSYDPRLWRCTGADRRVRRNLRRTRGCLRRAPQHPGSP